MQPIGLEIGYSKNLIIRDIPTTEIDKIPIHATVRRKARKRRDEINQAMPHVDGWRRR